MAGQHRLAIGVPGRVEVDQQLGSRKALLERFLDRVDAVVRMAYGPVARHPDVELDEVVRPAGARAQVVEAVELGMFGGGGEEGGALRFGPFAVHQLVDRTARRAPRSDQQPQRDEQAELDGLHDLRTRTSGSNHFVQFHVWVPGDWTISHAHDRIDVVEEALQARFPATEILIHLDPHGHTDRETMLPSSLTESS